MTMTEEHPKYQAGHESEEEHWPTTDELVAMARTNREGKEYPNPEELLRNLPRMLRGICDFVLSGEADVYHTAYAIASLRGDRARQGGSGPARLKPALSCGMLKCCHANGSNQIFYEFGAWR